MYFGFLGKLYGFTDSSQWGKLLSSANQSASPDFPFLATFYSISSEATTLPILSRFYDLPTNTFQYKYYTSDRFNKALVSIGHTNVREGSNFFFRT